jgi:hypothetical protein
VDGHFGGGLHLRRYFPLSRSCVGEDPAMNVLASRRDLVTGFTNRIDEERSGRAAAIVPDPYLSFAQSHLDVRDTVELTQGAVDVPRAAVAGHSGHVKQRFLGHDSSLPAEVGPWC